MQARTQVEPKEKTMTYTLPKGTLAPFRPILSKPKANPNKVAHRAKVLFSRAPAHLGLGRPAQSAAGQP